MGKKDKFGEEFFYLPNSLVDEHVGILGTRGVALYVVLARCSCIADYPTALDLSTLLKISQLKVKELLKKLRILKLLNTSDVRAILGDEDE